MWVIIGEFKYGSGHGSEETVVARFSTEQLAKDYLEASKLKTQTWRKKFRGKSLLGHYSSAWVEWQDEDQPVLDPPINF